MWVLVFYIQIMVLDYCKFTKFNKYITVFVVWLFYHRIRGSDSDLLIAFIRNISFLWAMAH